MKKLSTISTKNPNNLLINTISKVKEYYSDFDIIIIIILVGVLNVKRCNIMY